MPIIRYKVLVAQVDSTELDMQQELGLDSANVYFTDAGYTSDNVQEAIVETITKSGSARRPFAFVYDANAGTGRWLERSKGVSTQTSPYVVAQDGTIRTTTLSTKGNSTCTVTLYKNAVAVTTLSLSAASIVVNNTLSIAVLSGDTLSAQVTAGTCTEPGFDVEVQTGA